MKRNIWGLKLVGNSKLQLLDHLETDLKQGSSLKLVFTPNPEQVVLSQSSPEFKAILRQADYLLPDGSGLVVASRVLAWRGKFTPLSERIPGVEVVSSLLALAAESQLKVLVIGGRGYGRLAKKYPTAMWLEGYRDASQPTGIEEREVTRTLAKLKPAIVLVALGAPVQEQWLVDHKLALAKAGVKIGMAVGGSFDILLGKVSRAPDWMQSLGLEWLYRLVQEPWRWRRQLKLVSFMGLVVQEYFS